MGFGLSFAFFRDIYLYLGSPGDMVSTDAFYKVLNRSNLKDMDFSREKFPPGTSGEAGLYKALKSEVLPT